MSLFDFPASARRAWVCALVAFLGSPVLAAPPQATTGDSALVTRLRPSEADAAAGQHPLSAVIDYARREQRYLRQTVNDFTCRLVKRERIGGILQDMHFIEMQVREEVVADGRVVQPLSIFLRFLGPALVEGRKVIYVEGQNEGKMLVRNGGRHFEYVLVRLDPDGEKAREETLVPLTEIGFTRLLGKMIDVLERHRTADPSGENTTTQRISGAKINARPCTVIRVTHPRPMEGLEFHLANVYVDNELHVPLRVDYSGWPKSAGGTPPLIAEYTYTRLELNVNLPDATFNRGRLRSGRD